MTRVSRVLIILSIPCFTCFFSCKQKPGDPEKFSEVSFDQLTEENVPKGLVLSKGIISLDPDYDLVHSSDSTKALIIRPGGGGGGTLAMRCDCDGLVKLGCIVVREGILTCKPLLCTSCKPVLLVYDGLISRDQFIR